MKAIKIIIETLICVIFILPIIGLIYYSPNPLGMPVLQKISMFLSMLYQFVISIAFAVIIAAQFDEWFTSKLK